MTSIGRVCLPTEQRDPSVTPDRPFRYIDIAAIDKDAKRITSAPEIMGAAAPSRARKAVRAGDVLVSTVRPNLNAVAVVPEDLDGEIASTGFCVLRANPDVCEGRFIFYWCLTPEFISSLIAQMRGANYPAVSDATVKRTSMPLAAPREQRRIVDLLERADGLRRKRVEADAMAEGIIPALFSKMFGDPPTNPKGWRRTPLGEVTAIDAPMVDPRQPEFADLPHIGPDRIEEGTGQLLPAKTAREEGLISGKYLFDSRHVLYSKIRPYLRKVALAAGRGLCSADMYPVTPIPGCLTREFLWALLLSTAFTNYTTEHSGRANIPKLNREQFAAYPCAVPPIELQRVFSGHAIRLQECACQRELARRCIGDLFSTMLHRAFTGELTAGWRKAHMKELMAEMEHQARVLESPTQEMAFA
jgi:type I restriction enzyme S subunit